VRHLLNLFRNEEIAAPEAARQLNLSRRHFYDLYSDYLRACAYHQQDRWTPGVSGGNHQPPWPQAVTELFTKFLCARPPLSYSFAASEVHRRTGHKLDRATVRRWALAHHLAHAQPLVRPKAPVKRWQRQRIGELWQLDASPHPWFPGSKTQYPMLNLMDDCSRLFTGARLYERELLLSYFDFLPAAFAQHGLPLCLYVDYHSLFFTHSEDGLTQLGWALKFYDISLDYAPTPQAKGKVERNHQFWQHRLPALFAAEGIADLAPANGLIDSLRRHHNAHEKHRELAMTPLLAWKRAQKEGRTVLRPKPKCPWWAYVWSVRTRLKVASDGTVPVGSHRFPLTVPPGTPVIRCQHPDGRFTVLLHPPAHGKKPIRLLEYGSDSKVRV